MCSSDLRQALDRTGLPYVVKPKDGTFYAPKIDIYVDDALGREWQCATIQADLTMLPERFDLTYIDEEGKERRPIAIHRAIYGSLERFIGILIEHFAGAFPLWIAPVQAVLVPIADRHVPAAQELATILRDRGLRVDVDASDNRMQNKIRLAQEQKVPYMVVLGDREVEARTASPRTRAGEQHAVRAWIADDLDRWRAARSLRRLIESVQHAHDFVCPGVLERHDLDVFVTGLIHAPDQRQHALNVLRPVGDDQRVGRHVGREMSGLRKQRPQDRHELRGGDVLEHDRLGHVVGAGAEACVQIGRAHV